jgi:hypothetical protein
VIEKTCTKFGVIKAFFRWSNRIPRDVWLLFSCCVSYHPEVTRNATKPGFVSEYVISRMPDFEVFKAVCMIRAWWRECDCAVSHTILIIILMQC